MRRKCWDCGNIAEHQDSIIPHVLCTVGGSQDTRLLKAKAATGEETCSLSAEIALALATVPRDDYRGTLAATDRQLDRFGIPHLQRAK
jgi:chemotaxis methyl-accepting protein methylase